MHHAEILFYSLFSGFIVTLLLVDLLIFDRHSHQVSIKEALMWTSIWVILALSFAVFIYNNGEMIHGIKNLTELKEVIAKYDYNVKIIDNDYITSLKLFNREMTIDYLTGYLLEKTLSLDNLFVMLLIFKSFKVKSIHYKRILFWGILGAIILRTVFIFGGAALLIRFRWILYLFGIFLLYSGVKVFFEKDEAYTEPQNSALVKFLSKHLNVFPRFVGEHFFVKPKNKFWHVTPLFVVLILIEVSDIIFAFDSIPAIFSVTLDPYIIFFSNIFAILGLRALFFLLAKIVDKFYMLQKGISILLIFIGLKLILNRVLEHIGFHNIYSLIFILLVLTISIIGSILFPKPQNT